MAAAQTEEKALWADQVDDDLTRGPTNNEGRSSSSSQQRQERSGGGRDRDRDSRRHRGEGGSGGCRNNNRRDNRRGSDREAINGNNNASNDGGDGVEGNEGGERWQHDLYDKGSDNRRRQRNNDREREHGGGRRESNITASDKIETGIVCTVKDGFGFIESCDREGDLFFHFTELAKEMPPESIKRGLEVEYTLASDRRSGKLSAVNLKLLPQGTVVFEEVSQESFRGVVSKAIPSSSSKRGDNNSQNEAMGRIDAKSSEGSVLTFAFGTKDLENPRVSLQPGDEVEFNILLHKKSQRQTATNVKIHKLAGDRECGVVNNILPDKGYGFINCCDRDNRGLWFHFSELFCDEEEIDAGSEVEFAVANDKRSEKPRDSATRILLLPKGTVKFETVLEGRKSGTVDSEIVISHFDPRSREPKREEEPGVILLQEDGGSDQPTTEKLSFRSKDLSDPRLHLRKGDEVEFQILIEKKTKKRFATQITLIRAAPVVREQGVIASIKNSTGIISSVERLDEIMFHFSEFEDYKRQKIEPGMEVEFTLNSDSKINKLRATDIKILPNGTVSFEEVLEGRVTGKVTKEMKKSAINKRNPASKTDENGLIEYVVARKEGEEGESQKETIPFSSKVTIQPKGESTGDASGASKPLIRNLIPGDVVEFSIAVDKRTKQKKASNVMVAEELALPREKGYISQIKSKSSSGFIRRLSDLETPPTEDVQFFFYFNDVRTSGKIRDELKVGLPVDFCIYTPSSSSSATAPSATEEKKEEKTEEKKEESTEQTEPKQEKEVTEQKEHKEKEQKSSKSLRAVRIEIVSKEPVAFEDILEATYQGVIEKEIKKKKGDIGVGTIAYLSPQTNEKVIITYADVEKGLKLKTGEAVDFSIAQDKLSKEQKAVNIKRGKQRGIVRSIKSNYGFIERYDKLAKEQLFFHLSELPKDINLRIGDEVEFIVVFNDKKSDLNAQKIIRTKEAQEMPQTQTQQAEPNKAKLLLNKKPVETPAVVTLRNPLMPDNKTKGFLSRAPLSPVEREKLVEAALGSLGGSTRLIAAALSNIST